MSRYITKKVGITKKFVIELTMRKLNLSTK